MRLRVSTFVFLISLGASLLLQASVLPSGRSIASALPGAYRPDTSNTAPISSNVSHLNYCTATHDVGKLSLLMTNGGMIGIGQSTPYTADSSGCHLGSVVLGSENYAGEYPLGSGDKCIQGAALWVGAITQRGDTVVSVGLDNPRPDGVDFDFYPDVAPFGDFFHASLLNPSTAAEARSDQDYRAVYTDTFVQGLPGLLTDWRTHKEHEPLEIRVTQTSSQWSNALVDKFILIEYKIANIGRQDLHSVYAGLFFHPLVGHMHSTDHFVNPATTGGYLRTAPSSQGCGFLIPSISLGRQILAALQP